MKKFYNLGARYQCRYRRFKSFLYSEKPVLSKQVLALYSSILTVKLIHDEYCFGMVNTL